MEGDGLLFVVSVPAAVGGTGLHHPAQPRARRGAASVGTDEPAGRRELTAEGP